MFSSWSRPCRLFRITNLNGLQDITDVSTGAGVLVDRCLLQTTTEGYRLHDLVLEYLQLTISMDGGRLAKKASTRQARYLARVAVFLGYAARGPDVRTGGLYSLVALWNSVKKLDGNINVEECYERSLEGVVEVVIAIQVARLLIFQVRAGLPRRLHFSCCCSCTYVIDTIVHALR